MRYLNKQEEERLNQILKKISAPSEKVDVRMGRTIVYRGIPGETPEIDRINSKQLENLDKAVNHPEKSTGTITISKEQVYQVQNGQQAVNTLRLSQTTSSAQQQERAQQTAQLQSSLAELKDQSEKQQAEIARIREVMQRQAQLLEKVTTPTHKRLGSWFEQAKERVNNQLQNRIQAVNNSVQEKWKSVQQQAQDFADKVTGRTALRQEVNRLQEEVQRLTPTDPTNQQGQEASLERSSKIQQQGQGQPSNSRLSEQKQPSQLSKSQVVAPDTKPSERELKLEQLSDKQREQVFQEYARQQQEKDVAKFSEKDQIHFERLVSPREKEKLLEMRVEQLKKEYRNQILNFNLNNSFVQDFNNKTSLAQQYLDFKKQEETENEIEKKRLDRGILGTTPPNSSKQFNAWYYMGTASEEFQLKIGLVPPQDITPAGAVWHAQYIADCKRLEAEKLIEVEKQRLKEAGLSPEEIRKRENTIHKAAFDKVSEQWKQEKAEQLKAWQESKANKSFQRFAEKQPNVEIQFRDLQQWRQEAQALGRSKQHLEKIDQIVNSFNEKAKNPATFVEVNERDFKVMQRDCNEFKQQQHQPKEERQQPTQAETPARGIRR